MLHADMFRVTLTFLLMIYLSGQTAAYIGNAINTQRYLVGNTFVAFKLFIRRGDFALELAGLWIRAGTTPPGRMTTIRTPKRLS